ncbi:MULTISPECIES: hypothetical protein [Agrobacterium]|uniref:hypothetical protein n=1 Tax=Agrobacterium TaxID=357 RepID=UPI002300F170|nr:MULTISPECIES: hypothetical protein [Agrobacterium]MDA5627077.1 hypothetical protein [Agrobacterium sp. ST15.16.055]MDA6980122.1 hypothetical protein [Agrobacterium salinitolerans]
MTQIAIDPDALKSFMEEAIDVDREEMKNILIGLEKFVKGAEPDDPQAKHIQDQIKTTFLKVGEQFDEALDIVFDDPVRAVEICQEAHSLIDSLSEYLKKSGFSWDHFASPVVKNRTSDLEAAHRYRDTVYGLINDPIEADNEPLQKLAKEALDYSYKAIAKLEKQSTEINPFLSVEVLLDLEMCAASLNDAYTYRKGS